jgi:hypothetical protein
MVNKFRIPVLALLGFGFVGIAGIAMGFATGSVPLVGIGSGVVFAVGILSLVFAFNWSRQMPDREVRAQPSPHDSFERAALSARWDYLEESKGPF